MTKRYDSGQRATKPEHQKRRLALEIDVTVRNKERQNPDTQTLCGAASKPGGWPRCGKVRMGELPTVVR